MISHFYFPVERIQSRSVPTPVSLFRYISDPGYEHEDFTLASACTLRARVSNTCVVIILQCVYGSMSIWVVLYILLYCRNIHGRIMVSHS